MLPHTLLFCVNVSQLIATKIIHSSIKNVTLMLIKIKYLSTINTKSAIYVKK